MNVVEDEVYALVEKERANCLDTYGPLHSGHEGYAVVKEEIEETHEELDRVEQGLESLWEDLRFNDPYGCIVDAKEAREAAIRCACEAIQAAAVFSRILDVLEATS